MAGAVAAAVIMLLQAPSAARAQLPSRPDSGPPAITADAVPGTADAATPGTVPPAADTLAASAGVAPDTVTVGDHFRVLVRVRAPAGASVAFPSFDLVEPVEAMDSVRVRRDSAGAWIASYTLAAWITSDSLVAAIPFRVRSADGSARDLRVRVELPHVRSVLPADSALHVPKPAKAVIPIVVAGPTPTGWLLPAALLLLVLIGIVWLALRRRMSFVAAPVDPRAAALKELAGIERAGLLARDESYEYHVRTSRVLRQYLSGAAGVGEDLTSTEAVEAVRAHGADTATTAELDRLLRDADSVKFAGIRSGLDRRRGDTHGAAAARWIANWPEPVAGEREKAA